MAITHVWHYPQPLNRNASAYVDSPAVRLAPEILTYIFLYLIDWPIYLSEDDAAQGEMGSNLVAASQVCYAWREVSLTSPLLWVFIGPNMGLTQIQEFLSRSKSMPLDAVLLNLFDRPKAEAEAALRRVLLETYRSRELQLATVLEPMMETKEIYDILCDTLPGVAADSLRSFTLCVYKDSETPDEANSKYALRLPDYVFRGDSHNLKHICIDSPFYISPISTLLSTTTSLEFTGIHDTLLMAILFNTPNIEKVKAELNHDFDGLSRFSDFIPHQTDSLTSLQSIDITGRGICPYQLFYVLGRSPQLRHLGAVFDYTSGIEFPPVSLSLPHLETVCLDNITEEAFHLMLAFPPWKAVQTTPHIDLCMNLDWDLAEEDKHFLRSFFDIIPGDGIFEAVHLGLNPAGMITVSVVPALEIHTDIARDPFAAEDAHLRMKVQINSSADATHDEHSIYALFDDMFSSRTLLTRHLSLSKGGQRFPELARFACYDSTMEWRRLLHKFPNLETLILDVVDSSPLLEALYPSPRDDRCEILPNLDKIAFISMEMEFAEYPWIGPEAGRLSLLVDILLKRRESVDGHALSSFTFYNCDEDEPFTESEIMAVKGEVPLVLRLDFDSELVPFRIRTVATEL